MRLTRLGIFAALTGALALGACQEEPEAEGLTADEYVVESEDEEAPYPEPAQTPVVTAPEAATEPLVYDTTLGGSPGVPDPEP